MCVCVLARVLKYEHACVCVHAYVCVCVLLIKCACLCVCTHVLSLSVHVCMHEIACVYRKLLAMLKLIFEQHCLHASFLYTPI